jgi:hypothetical protein
MKKFVLFCRGILLFGCLLNSPVAAEPFAPAPDDQEHPSVVSNGDGYFVVWADKREYSANEYDIYGARVSSTGEVLDPGGIAICTDPGRQTSPCVAFDGTRYLVVWEDDRASTSQFLLYHIYGARLTADGRVLDTNGFRITTNQITRTGPAVASNGDGFFAVWVDWHRTNGAIADVYGSPISADGVVANPDGIPLATAPMWQTDPRIVSGNDEYLVTWHDSYAIFGLRIGEDGAKRGSPFRISSGGAEDRYGVAWNGRDYFVAWGDERNSEVNMPWPKIYGTLVRSNGVVASPDGVLISNHALSQNRPRVASDGENFLVAWEEYYSIDAQIPDIYAAKITSAGNVGVPSRIAANQTVGAQSYVDVAFEGLNYLVVWQDARSAPGQYYPYGAFDIFGTLLSAAGDVLNEEGFLISGASPNVPPTVRMVSPSNGATFAAPANIVLVASVEDPDGEAETAAVEFFSGTNLIGMAVPDGHISTHVQAFQFPWRNVSPGTYLVSVRATDTAGALGVSGQITINVYAQTNPPPPGTELWEVATGSVYSGPAVAPDGTIYAVGGNPISRLYAVTPEGSIKWQAVLGEAGSAPAVGADGTIYVGAKMSFRAYRPNGTLLWATAFPINQWFYNVSAPAIAPDGTIYVGTGSAEKGLRALRPDGTQKWIYVPAGEYAEVYTPVIGPDGTIYFGTYRDSFYAVNPDGTKRWSVPMDGYNLWAAVGGDGTIYVTGGENKLIALGPDGTRRWERGIAAGLSAPVIGPDGTIYVGCGHDITLYAINPTGSTKWSHRIGGNVGGTSASPAVDSQGNVYAGFAGSLFAISASGARLWSFATLGGFTAPSLTPDGTLYVGSAADTLFAFRANAGLAQTPWPMFQRDLRHTGAAPQLPDTDLPVVSVTATIPETTEQPLMVFTADGETVAAGDMVAPVPAHPPGRFTITREGNTNAPLTVAYSLSGTASNGVDYAVRSGSVTLPAGVRSAAVMIFAVDDRVVEGDETVVLTLSLGANYRVGTPASATVIIHDSFTPPGVLIPAGTVWQYYNVGAEPSGIWRAPGFDDSAWPSGRAELGYGDGDEATVLTFGPDASNKHITTYFRRSFNLFTRAGISNLIGRIERDDGAIVYLNGTEVFRNNMPAGATSYSTLATMAVEDEWLEFVISPNLLVPGRNTVAVEMHQVNPASSDLSFNFELRAVGGPLPPELPTVTVVATDPDAAESGSLTVVYPGRFTFHRTGNLENPLSVPIAVGGTAINGVDYVRVTNRVVFPAGASEARLDVFPISDELIEGTETVTVLLPTPMCAQVAPPPPGCYEVGSPSEATVFIADFPATNRPPRVLIVTPQNGATFEAGADILLGANAPNFGTPVTNVAFFANGTKLGDADGPFLTPAGAWLLTWSNAPAGQFAITARAIDAAGLRATSAPVHISVMGPNTNLPPTVLISTGAVWQYYDVGAEPSGTWRTQGFDDIAWSAGAAELGYGEADETTVVSYGPEIFNKHITTYFRRSINLFTTAGLSNLTARVLRDDGVIVYLNGAEVFRNNLPDDDISFNTLAVLATEEQWLEFTIPATLLVPGRNTVAVEMHQVNPASSDISFDFELRTGGTPQPELPVVTVVASDPEAAETGLLPVVHPGRFTFSRTGNLEASLTAYFAVSGSAVNDVDYAPLSNHVVFTPGTNRVSVDVYPLSDHFAEGTETVVVTLQHSFCDVPIPPSSDCYRVGSPNQATVFIADFPHEPTNRPPHVVIVTPQNGAAFEAGANILLGAEAPSFGIPVTNVAFFANGLKLGDAVGELSTPSGGWLLTWSNAPAGQFSVTARALDATGRRATSAPVNITVRGPHTNALVVTSNADSGPGSLRNVIANAPPGSTITFAVLGEINLRSRIDIHGQLNIQGPGANRLAVQRSEAAGTPAFSVFKVGGHVRIFGLTVRNGRVGTEDVYEDGAGIDNDGSLTLSECVIADNAAVGEYSRGGGICNRWRATLVAERSAFVNNSCDGFYGEGGAIYNFGRLTLTNCTFSGNSVGGWGGGIHNDMLSDGTAIDSCTFTANRAGFGGGIFNRGAPPNMVSPVHFRNTIVVGNTGHDIGHSSLMVSGGHNLIGTIGDPYGSLGLPFVPGPGDRTNVTTAAARLGPLQDNGGSTPTHALLSASPAINNGSPDNFPATDQRGVARPFGPRADIGAFELDTTNNAPFVQINSPTNAQTFSAGANIELHAYAQDAEDAYALSVEFFVGDRSLGLGTFVPARCAVPFCPYYSVIWSNVPPGSYSLTAIATDSSGNSGLSEPVNITVFGVADADSDGVADDRDRCSNTAAGAIVNADGCSIAQLCPCDTPWRNHAEYVRCVMRRAWEFYREGLINADQRRAITRAAVDSSCGRRQPPGRETPLIHVCPQTGQECNREGVRVVVSGDIAGPVVIETSADLINWRPVAALEAALVGDEIVFPMDSKVRARFYRVRGTAAP